MTVKNNRPIPLPVITVVREPGQKASFAAHMAFAARRAGQRVLMVDLARDGMLTRTLLPLGAEPGALSVSHLFAPSVGHGALEMPSHGVSLILADAHLIDTSLTMVGSASRLRGALQVLAPSHDCCIIETTELVSVESMAALRVANNVVTTVCGASASVKQMTRHIEQVSVLAAAAATPMQSPMLTVMPLPQPVTRDLDEPCMATFARRVLDVIAVRPAVATRRKRTA